MKKKIILLMLVLISGLSYSQTGLGTFFKEADTFFSKYVKNGKVDYKSVKANRTMIDHLYSQVNNMNLANADKSTKKAFYINAYNIAVIYYISKHYPIKSPLDHKGFFDKVKHKIGGAEMTLNDLEIKKVIMPYKDARIHFALVCAAVSCPKLASSAYLPTTLDKQLDKRTKLALNDNTFIRVKAKKVEISQIFKWYERDFTTNNNSVLSFINKYRDQKIPGSFALGYYEYNWQLNDLK